MYENGLEANIAWLEECELEREIAADVAERDMLIEMSEMAEEAAMVERDVFGSIEPPFDTVGAEDWDDWECYFDEGYDAWHEACSDILEVTGEMATSDVLGL